MPSKGYILSVSDISKMPIEDILQKLEKERKDLTRNRGNAGGWGAEALNQALYTALSRLLLEQGRPEGTPLQWPWWPLKKKYLAKGRRPQR